MTSPKEIIEALQVGKKEAEEARNKAKDLSEECRKHNDALIIDMKSKIVALEDEKHKYQQEWYKLGNKVEWYRQMLATCGSNPPSEF